MKGYFHLAWLAPALLAAAAPMRASAELEWRVSVKIFLDEYGMRPQDGVTFGHCCDLNTDEEIFDMIDRANDILRGNGPSYAPVTEWRGYQLDLVEIIEISIPTPPPSTVRACSNDPTTSCETVADCDPWATCNQVTNWFYAPSHRRTRNAIQAEATASAAAKALWGWNDDAINVYIVGQDGSGTAWYNEMVLLGQDLSSTNTPFHEIGHFMTLNHTHGGGGLSPDCVTPMDDEVDDTLLDIIGDGCVWSRDDIAAYNFPTQCGGGPCTYAGLSAADQHRVEQVIFNLMTYRSDRDCLTPGQLDRMTDYANSTVNYITDGHTRFVDHNGSSGSPDGSSTAPYLTVADGLSHANGGDIVLIRRGTYNETMIIDQRVHMLSSRGDVVIGSP